MITPVLLLPVLLAEFGALVAARGGSGGSGDDSNTTSVAAAEVQRKPKYDISWITGLPADALFVLNARMLPNTSPFFWRTPTGLLMYYGA